MVAHGGAVGEGLYWAATTLFQRLGAHILVVLHVRSPASCCSPGRRWSPPSARPAGRCARRAPGRATSPAPSAPSAPARPTPGRRRRDAAITISRERETDTFETERLAAELDDEAETIAVREGADPTAGPTDEPGEEPGVEPSPAAPEAAGGSRRPRRWAAGARATGSPSPRRSTTGCRRRRCSIGAAPTRARTCATARRPRPRCSSRCATSGSRRGCSARSAART